MPKILNIFEKLEKKIDEAYDGPNTPENRKKLVDLLVKKHHMLKIQKDKHEQSRRNGYASYTG